MSYRPVNESGYSHVDVVWKPGAENMGRDAFGSREDAIKEAKQRGAEVFEVSTSGVRVASTKLPDRYRVEGRIPAENITPIWPPRPSNQAVIANANGVSTSDTRFTPTCRAVSQTAGRSKGFDLSQSQRASSKLPQTALRRYPTFGRYASMKKDTRTYLPLPPSNEAMEPYDGGTYGDMVAMSREFLALEPVSGTYKGQPHNWTMSESTGNIYDPARWMMELDNKDGISDNLAMHPVLSPTHPDYQFYVPEPDWSEVEYSDWREEDFSGQEV